MEDTGHEIVWGQPSLLQVWYCMIPEQSTSLRGKTERISRDEVLCVAAGDMDRLGAGDIQQRSVDLEGHDFGGSVVQEKLELALNSGSGLG